MKSGAPERHRPLRLLRDAFVIALVTLLLFVLVEGAFRVALRLKTGAWPMTQAEANARFVETIGAMYERHPYLLVHARPGASIRIAGHEVQFDERGYRLTGAAAVKSPNTRRILCAGGSTTFDLLAANDAETWPSRLGAMLRNDGFDVVNAGFPGWTTVESLISLELRDVDAAPDIVVVFAGINDQQPASHQPFTRDYTAGHADLLPRVLGVEHPALPLTARLVFLEWLRDRLGAKPREDAHAPVWRWSGTRRDDVTPEAADVFERNIRSTVAVAAAHHAAVILVPQHVRIRAGNTSDAEYVESWAPGVTARGFERGLERSRERLKKIASEGLALYVDPFEGNGFTDADFADPMHFSASGSARFAAALASAIRQESARRVSTGNDSSVSSAR